jgi:short-subunit dehydrogenase
MRNPQQTWWLTGAGSGIGLALAERLANAGHRVYASSRSADALAALTQRFPQQVVALPVDVSEPQAVATLFESTSDAPLHLDGVILSAGICEYIDLPDLNVASVTRMMQVNYLGVVHTCALALPLLKRAYLNNPRQRPKLIGIASMSSYVGFPRAEGYGASKAAMAYFLDSLRCDVQQQIDISIVYPGFVATRLTTQNHFDMPFLWTVDQAADYIFARLWQGRQRMHFPWQLHVLLRLAQALPALWYGTVIKRLSNHDS